MERMAKTVWVAVLTAVLASPAALQGSLAERLPAETLVYLEAPSLAEAAARLREHPVERMLRNAEVKEFLAPLLKQAAGMQAELAARTGLKREDLQGLCDALGGRVEAALLPPAAPEGRLPFLFARVETQARERVERLLTALLEAVAGRAPPGLELKSSEREGRTIHTLSFPGGALHAWVGAAGLVVTTDLERALGLVGGKTPAPPTPLTSNVDFRRAREATRAGQADVFAYCDLPRLLDTVLAAAGPQAEMAAGIVEELGLKGLRTLSVSLTLGRAGFTERDHIGLATERKGILALMDAYGEGLTLHRRVSENVVAFVGYRMDLLELYERALDLLTNVIASVDPGRVAKLDAVVQRLESGELGFKLREDFLAPLGDEFALGVQLPPAGLIPEVFLLFKLRDPKKIVASLDELQKRLPAEDAKVRKSRYRGHPLYTVRIPGSMVMPTVGVGDDLLIVALFPRTVRKLLVGTQHALAEAPVFRQALALVGVENLDRSCTFLFVDLQRTLRYFYENATPLLAQIDPDKLPPGLDLTALPTTEAVVSHFLPMASVSLKTATGVTSTTVAPVPPVLVQFLVSAANAFSAFRVERQAPPLVRIPPRRAPRGRLGVVARDLQEGAGCVVTEVEKGGAAAAAGIRVGDVILACDDVPVADVDALAARLRGHRAGDTVRVKIRRGDVVMVLEVTLKP